MRANVVIGQRGPCRLGLGRHTQLTSVALCGAAEGPTQLLKVFSASGLQYFCHHLSMFWKSLALLMKILFASLLILN